MRLTVKRNSQPNRLSALFKGRRSSATEKLPGTDDQKSDSVPSISAKVSGFANEDELISFYHSSRKRSHEAEYLTVLHRILQEQVINTTEVYNIAGHTIRVEVLEDTEL